MCASVPYLTFFSLIHSSKDVHFFFSALGFRSAWFHYRFGMCVVCDAASVSRPTTIKQNQHRKRREKKEIWFPSVSWDWAHSLKPMAGHRFHEWKNESMPLKCDQCGSMVFGCMKIRLLPRNDPNNRQIEIDHIAHNGFFRSILNRNSKWRLKIDYNCHQWNDDSILCVWWTYAEKFLNQCCMIWTGNAMVYENLQLKENLPTVDLKHFVDFLLVGRSALKIILIYSEFRIIFLDEMEN